ncbi:Speckle-type POZ protein-like isoform X2 [Aphelenchoides fujianensis]|nr:Speckle-type POZ protein-like isoform X2 [Aphelenchoides fujianensis]
MLVGSRKGEAGNATMADVLMELDDDSVLRWGIADFLQRWRQTDDGDFITSGLFVLQSEDGNIASFTADRKEATFEFERGLFEEFYLSRFCLLVHGYRVVPQAPPLRMEGNPVTSRFDQKFNDAAYTDVRIFVGDRVFHVYKAFLFLHSDVFRAMFKHKWKEQETNAVPIKDFEPEIVEAMLRFMYTGRVENLEQNARQLFLAADKYDVKLLRDLTVDHLCAKVALENVVEMLEFALEHPALEKLREWALDFAARHYPQLHDREEWKKFAVEDPPLVLRLMEKVVVHE